MRPLGDLRSVGGAWGSVREHSGEQKPLEIHPVSRPSRKPLVRYKSFRYQAESWAKPRRIVAKVEHHRGELFPRPGFIVTNMTLPSRSVVRFYNKRGTAEQWIKEGKQATHWTRFRANEVRLQLSVLRATCGGGGLPHSKSWSLLATPDEDGLGWSSTRGTCCPRGI